MHNLRKHIPSYSHGEDKLNGLDLETPNEKICNVLRAAGCSGIQTRSVMPLFCPTDLRADREHGAPSWPLAASYLTANCDQRAPGV